MENSKLVAFLKSLETPELYSFRDFVGSPYFNRNEELIGFADYLLSLAPEFPPEKLAKEVVFREVFSREEFDPKKLSYQMNYLLKLGEHFLGIQRFEKDPVRVHCNTLTEFIDRKLEKHYNYLSPKTVELVKEKPLEGTDFFFYQFLLSDISSKHFISQRVRKFDEYLQEASDHLDQYYFFQKLKFSVEMLNRQTILSGKYQMPFMEEVKDYLKEQDQLHPLINIYLQIFLSFNSPSDDDYFQKLMHLIEDHSASISAYDMREIYLYALNFCARKIRKGQNEYIPITLRLYRTGIEKKYLFDGQYLSHWTYNNVVKLALRVEQYDWIEDFIQKFNEFLAPEFQEDALHFNLAELYYQKKDYGKVLEHLNQLHFSDIHYHLGSRVTLIKTYYEADEIESLLSQLASFSTYLRRNQKISIPYKKTCLNFCNLLHQVMRNNPKKKEALREQIRTAEPLAERDWLMKVFEEERF